MAVPVLRLPEAQAEGRVGRGRGDKEGRDVQNGQQTCDTGCKHGLLRQTATLSPDIRREQARGRVC